MGALTTLFIEFTFWLTANLFASAAWFLFITVCLYLLLISINLHILIIGIINSPVIPIYTGKKLESITHNMIKSKPFIIQKSYKYFISANIKGNSALYTVALTTS